MAGDAIDTTWGEVATLEYGKTLKGYSQTRSTARVFGTNGPIGWHDEALWQGPGVIVGRKGAYRGVQYTTDPYWVIDTAYSVQPKPGVQIDLRWAYYQIRYLDPNTIDDGSPIPSTTRSEFYARRLRLPPISEQRAIAALLGALDDRIDLNRGIAETLETQARALFRSWFIDFDPVRAKTEGRPTGLPHKLDSLFPAALTVEGLPEGWRLGSISDLAQVNPSTPLRAEEAPYVDMAALPTAGSQIQNVQRRAPGAGAKFRNGDTLVARITPCLENGKTALVDCLADGETGWGSTEFIVFRPNSGTPAAIPYLLARHAPFRDTLITAMSGTSGRQRVQADVANRWPLPIPSAEVLAAFGSIVDPNFRRIRATSEHSRTLASLRDTLLPKLISGDLRIRDAEQAVAAA